MAVTDDPKDLTTEEFVRLKYADAIMGSETMLWLFAGSENWHQTHLDVLAMYEKRWRELGGKSWGQNADSNTT